MESVAKILIGARQARGWSRMELAEASGVSYSTICRIEQGEETTLSTARSLADALELSPRERAQCLGAS